MTSWADLDFVFSGKSWLDEVFAPHGDAVERKVNFLDW